MVNLDGYVTCFATYDLDYQIVMVLYFHELILTTHCAGLPFGVKRMFGIFKKMTRLQSRQKLAVNKFEKVQLESSPNPVNRRSKIQMALLCRTFIEGAEQSALYVDKVKLALATGVLMPLMAKSKSYQKIASSTGFVWTYAPDMYGA